MTLVAVPFFPHAAPTLLIIVLALLGLERFLELAINRRNVRWLRENGATFHAHDGFGMILLVQVLLFVLLPLEVLTRGATPHAWTWPLLALAIGAQALRYWVIRTLGNRWCIRVVTLPGRMRILRGPYRWLRHPNYVAVAIETLVIPLAFGAYLTAATLSVLQAIALLRRIRAEDAALTKAEHAPQTSSDAETHDHA